MRPDHERPGQVIDQEVAFHISERARQLEATGMDPDTARRRAEAEFGDVAYTTAYCRRQDRVHYARRSLRRALAGAVDDTRGALRSLARRPREVALPLAVLILGIALNALVFTVVRGVLMAPLPWLDAQRVYVLEEANEDGQGVRASYPVLERWREGAPSLEAAAAYTETAMPVSTDAGSLHVTGAAVSVGFFGLLDDPFLIGRGFDDADHRADAAGAVVIAESLWRRAFGARPDVLEHSIRMNGESFRVAAVVRDEARVPDAAELWLALERTYPGVVTTAGAKFLVALGRARVGASSETMTAELGGLAAEIEGGGPAARVAPVAERTRGDVQGPLLLLQAAVLLVLLTACANAGGMLLTRSIRRGSDLAVRTSLGAGPARVARTLLLEGLLLGLACGVIGLALAGALLEPLLTLVPEGLPRSHVIGLDPSVAVAAIVAAVGTGLLSALPPAVAGFRKAPGALLRGSRDTGGSSPVVRRTLDGLVVTQVALAMFLTAGAGLLLRSFVSTLAVDPGFDPERVTALDVSLPGYAYPEEADRLDFARTLLDEARALPGARSVALAANVPITGSNMASPLIVDGSDDRTPPTQVATVSEEYFEVMGIPFLEGSGFAGTDRPGGSPMILVDESLRRPEGRPFDVGDRLRSMFQQEMREVAGVVGSVRHRGLREETTPVVYVPFFQTGGRSTFTLLVRSDAPTAVVAAGATEMLQRLDPEIPADRVATMSGLIGRSLAEPRFYTTGLTIFGVLTLLLALAGCQATLAHRVAARRREMGLRLALGASGRSVRSMVLRRGLALTAVGALIGLGAALPAGRLLRSQLFGVEPGDPVTHVVLFAALLLAGALASDLPARRAAALDPAESLRDA